MSRAWLAVIGLAALGVSGAAAPRTAAAKRPPVSAPAKPQIALTPVRDFDRHGIARVAVDLRRRTVSLTRGNARLVMILGSRSAWLNNLPVRAPLPPTIVSDMVMVPRQFVWDALGLRGQTSPPPLPVRAAARGAISGRVLYAGAPQADIALRLVRATDNVLLPGFRARTGQDGRYAFSRLPDGAYRVHALVGDNPAYFHRATRRITVAGRAAQAPDINLGRVLSPIDPPSGVILSPAADIIFTWSPCPRAAKYGLSVVESDTSEEVFNREVSAPHVAVDLSRLKAGRQYEWRVVATDAGGSYLGGSPGSGAAPWVFSLAAD